MANNISSYKAKNMYFPSREAYFLIKEFDKHLSPLFSSGKEWEKKIFEDYDEDFLRFNWQVIMDKKDYIDQYSRFYGEKIIINKKDCVTENHYDKILMKLVDILKKIEKIGYIEIKMKIKYLCDDLFNEAFPNIADLHSFARNTSGLFNYDDTIIMKKLDYVDANLYDFSARLDKMGVF